MVTEFLITAYLFSFHADLSPQIVFTNVIRTIYFFSLALCGNWSEKNNKFSTGDIILQTMKVQKHQSDSMLWQEPFLSHLHVKLIDFKLQRKC